MAKPVQSRRKSGNRVLVVFNTPFLYGMERAVIELFDLLRADVEVTFLMTHVSLRLDLPVLSAVQEKGFSHTFFSDHKDWPRVGRPRSLRQLWGLVGALVLGNRDALRASRGHDMIYVPGFTYMFLPLLACIWFRLRRRRVILHFHDLAMDIPAQRLLSPLISDCIHSTEYGHQFVMRRYRYLYRKRHWTVSLAFEDRETKSVELEIESMMRRKRNLVFVGQVSYHKGVDLLLDAFANLANDYEDVALHFIGDGDFVDRLAERITTLQLTGRVFLWGYRRNACDLLARAYLYLHPTPPSRYVESFGRGVVEAMSLRVPSVCFPSGPLAEIVRSGQVGLVATEESAVSLGTAIRRFLDDPDFRERCAAQARMEYDQRYSAGMARRRWIRVFQNEGDVTLEGAATS